MGLKQTAEGRRRACGYTTGQITAAQVWQIKLFVNNHTPDGSENNGSPPYTEPSFTGYGAQGLSWTSGPTDDGTHAQSQADPVTFTCTATPGSPEDVYGYFVRDSSTGDLLWSERFSDAPRTISAVGDTIPVVPRYRHSDE